MKSLLVNPISVDTDFEADYSHLARLLHAFEEHQIDQVNWPDLYPYRPEVSFKIAYTQESLYIHYQVKEDFVRAQYIRPNENVWEDSCVEFFVSFDNRATYYNLEFNVLGTGLMGYGPAIKSERNRLDAATIEQISTYTQLVQKGGQKAWGLIMEIPWAVFKFTEISGFKQQQVFANFYKCGDALPQPHFISWEAINYATPNFHRPEYFGQLKFI